MLLILFKPRQNNRIEAFLRFSADIVKQNFGDM